MFETVSEYDVLADHPKIKIKISSEPTNMANKGNFNVYMREDEINYYT